VGIDFLVVTIPCALVYICGIVGSKQTRPTLRVLLREISSTTDIQLLPYMWLGVHVSLTKWIWLLKWRAINKGLKETIG
jgi:hypothetical protein